jgi:hypothetical protein
MTHDREQVGLSPEGEQRRETILRDLSAQLPEITSRRRQRKRVAVGACAMALLLSVGSVVVLTMNPPVHIPAPEIVVTPVGPEVTTSQLIDFAIVRTSDTIDPSIYVRSETEAINAMVISDDELLSELAAMGRPAGLIRMNGEVRLSRDVVDEQEPDDPDAL